MTYPRPTASSDYSPHSSRDKEYPTPAPTGVGQPGSAGDQSGGGHRRFRRQGPFSRLLHRGQPTVARAGVPTEARAGIPTGAAAGAPEAAAGAPEAAERAAPQRTRKGSALPAYGSSPAAAGPATTGDSGDSGESASPAGPPNAAPSDLAAAKPDAASAAPRPSGYRPQHRASRSEQPRTSSASARPAPGQLGSGEVNERLDPEQAAREYLAGCRRDEERGPDLSRNSDRAGRDTSPMPPFPGSARSRAAVPAPSADWVAGRADGPGRPLNATGSFPGRPVPRCPMAPYRPRRRSSCPRRRSRPPRLRRPRRPLGHPRSAGRPFHRPGRPLHRLGRPARPDRDRFAAARPTRIRTATRCAGS